MLRRWSKAISPISNFGSRSHLNFLQNVTRQTYAGVAPAPTIDDKPQPPEVCKLHFLSLFNHNSTLHNYYSFDAANPEFVLRRLTQTKCSGLNPVRWPCPLTHPSEFKNLTIRASSVSCSNS